MAVDRLGIDRVDGQTRLQQSSDEQSVVGFDNARQLLQPLWCSHDAQQEGGQLGQAFDGVIYLFGGNLLSLLIQDNHDMIG